MISVTLLCAAVIFPVFYFLLLPFILYFRDSKGLRRYASYSWLSGVYDIPYCYLSACGFRSKDLTEAHKKTPIIRIGPNNLSFGHVDAIRDIYGHATTCVKDLKYVITASEHPHLFDVVDKKQHGEKRKRLSAAFAIKHLQRWEFKVVRTTERLLKAFDERCTAPLPTGAIVPNGTDLTVDFNHWVNLFTIEAINYIALSADLGMLESGTDLTTAQRLDGTTYEAPYRKSQNASAYATSHFVWDYANFRSLVQLSKVLSPTWRQVWKEASPWSDVCYHQAVKRLERHQRGEQLDDFFSALMHDKSGAPYNLEWGEICGEVAAIIDAGADTTAIALTQVLELLIRHPEHMKTLREEIDGALQPEDVVASYDAVKNLPFLKACIDEV